MDTLFQLSTAYLASCHSNLPVYFLPFSKTNAIFTFALYCLISLSLTVAVVLTTSIQGLA